LLNVRFPRANASKILKKLEKERIVECSLDVLAFERKFGEMRLSRLSAKRRRIAKFSAPYRS
jgi:hypothetical protein